MEQLKEQHRAARKTLLAHQHSFGAAVNALEQKLESFIPQFDEFDRLTDTGNYLSARELVITVQDEGQKFFLNYMIFLQFYPKFNIKFQPLFMNYVMDKKKWKRVLITCSILK